MMAASLIRNKTTMQLTDILMSKKTFKSALADKIASHLLSTKELSHAINNNNHAAKMKVRVVKRRNDRD